MALLSDAKTQGAGFGNKAELVRVVYDFSVDGGAVGDLTVMTADSDCVVMLHHAAVKTAVTSGGALTLSLGKGAAGTDFMSAVAVGSLTLDSLHVSGAAVKLAAGEIISQAIGAAAATAGKVEYVLEVLKY